MNRSWSRIGYVLCFTAGGVVAGLLVPQRAERPAHGVETVPAPAERPAGPPAGTADGGEPRPPSDRAADGLLGVLAAPETVELAAAGAGTLEVLTVAVGDVVRRGEAIARISLDDLDARRAAQAARLRDAGVAVERSRLEVDLARRKAQRRQGLQELFSLEEREQAELELERALLELEASRAREVEAEAELASLNEQIERRTMVAPIDGLVSERFADPGTTVAAAQPVVRIVATSPWVVRFAVPEVDRRRYSAGTPVRVALEGAAEASCGTIERVAPELDESSRLVFAEARLPPGGLAGVPVGTAVRVRVAEGGDCA
jgi:HlyD family secretion protein